jgi:hypothetical protein
MRTIDEANKVVAFWDNWIKTVSTTMPTEEHRNSGTELRIRLVNSDARHLMADLGAEVINIYRAQQFRALREFKFESAEFQAYRAGLPWYRRTLLFYKSPNSEAKRMKILFHLYLWMVVFTLAGEPLIDPFKGHIRASFGMPPYQPSASATALLAILNAVIIGVTVYLRRASIKYENDPSFFFRDQMRRRYSEVTKFPKRTLSNPELSNKPAKVHLFLRHRILLFTATSITWVKESESSPNERSFDESFFGLPTAATSKTRARNRKRPSFRHRWFASPHGGDFPIQIVPNLLERLNFFGENEGEYPLMVGFTGCHTYTH